MALFRFDGVTVETERGPILREVTAEIPEPGITAVLGPSGAGKSTLLRLCNRLEVPTSGTVLFRDDDVAGLDPMRLRRRVGMVFQRPAVFGGTVRDNLAVAAPEASDEVVCRALERAGLDGEFLDRRADELSGGEAQRMCLARTLVTEPEVLLMDEPTTGLDAGPRLALERSVRHLADDHRVSVVWVTHLLDQMERLADRVLVVVGGRLRFSGTPAGLAEADADVAAFLSGDVIGDREGDDDARG